MPYSQDQAAELLDPLAKPNAKTEQQLLKELRELAGEPEPPKHVLHWIQFEVDRQEAGRLLRGMDRAQAAEWAARFAPSLGPRLAALADRTAQFPYQTDVFRRAYRSPGFPRLSDLWLGEAVLAGLRHCMIWNEDLEFCATWGGHISRHSAIEGMSILLADELSAGNKAIEDVLIQTVEGRHEKAVSSRTLFHAACISSRTDLHLLLRDAVLSAGREEGLRQEILWSVDVGAPEILHLMLRAIQEHQLLRFSSVLRACLVWMGVPYQDDDPDLGRKIARALDFFDGRALDWEDPFDVHIGMWFKALSSAEDAIAEADQVWDKLPKGSKLEAIAQMSAMGHPKAIPVLAREMNSPHLDLAGAAMNASAQLPKDDRSDPGLVTGLWRLTKDLPKKTEQGPSRGDAFDNLVDTCPESDLPLVFQQRTELPVNVRSTLADRVGGAATLSEAEKRSILVPLLADVSSDVRQSAADAFPAAPLDSSEALELEGHLKRKGSDLRVTLFGMLLKQGDEAVLASIGRLLAAKDARQRLAGLELALSMATAKRSVESASAAAAAYKSNASSLLPEERAALEAIEAAASPGGDLPCLSNVFGLLDPAFKPNPSPPRNLGYPLFTPASFNLIASLDEFIASKRDLEVFAGRVDGEDRYVVLGSDPWLVRPSWRAARDGEPEPEEPLAELWAEWLASLPSSCRDEDGCELARAALVVELAGHVFFGQRIETLVMERIPEPFKAGLPPLKMTHSKLIRSVMDWRVRNGSGAMFIQAFLNGLEQFMHTMSGCDGGAPSPKWRDHPVIDCLQWFGSRIMQWHADAAGPEEARRWLDLEQWRDRPTVPYAPELDGQKADPDLEDEEFDDEDEDFEDDDDDEVVYLGANEDKWFPNSPVEQGTWRRRPPTPSALKAALDCGAATEEEALFAIAGDRDTRILSTSGVCLNWRFRAWKPDTDALGELSVKVITAAIEVEIDRGEQANDASRLLRARVSAPNRRQTLRILSKNVDLSGARSSSDDSRASSFWRLLAASSPEGGEDTEAFALEVKEAGITEPRLLELAFIAPDWARHVEQALAAPGLADAVWWLVAHTRDVRIAPEEGEWVDSWTAQVAERSSVPPQSLAQGAVDIDWYRRVKSQVAPEVWSKLTGFAKFSSWGNAHARAILASQALDGQVSLDDLKARIEKSRSQDAVRCISLLPFEPGREKAELRSRYLFLQEFLRGSRKFGAQRQASEKAAVEAAMENLARAVGARDPIRLAWQLESEEVQDLREGGVTVEAEGVAITLAFNPIGRIEILAEKGGKALSDVPSKLRKDPRVAALFERKKQIGRQEPRARAALEEMMLERRGLLGMEIGELLRHPGLSPMLESLLFQGPDGCGFPAREGAVLAGLAGDIGVAPEAEYIVAHPHALALDGSLAAWRAEVFNRERIQPFKQVFRELYVPTESERERTESTRWSGHQVLPRQALAILGKRGWIASHEDYPKKALRASGLVARLTLDGFGGSPADMEGLTLESVWFAHAGQYKPLPLGEVDPLAFSEVMRDIDLIVSVASSMGHDPEASESTAEMRGELVRETARLLKLANVEVGARHVVIKGALAEYTVHLGSAEAMAARRHLALTAVQQPQRGRLFLPFVDEDPKTAEVVSKVIMLARDQEIRDPSILSQIAGI